MTCPTCGQGQLDATTADANHLVACTHCGRRAYAGYVAEATYLVDLRDWQDQRLGWLTAQVRAGEVPPAPATARASSAPALLVLGTGLLVIAAMVFVAVVWNRIGAGGQALTLSTIVAITAVLAIRLPARLAATAEALAATSIAVLTIELLSAPHLGILHLGQLDWGNWYDPAAFGVVAAAGLAGARTYRLKAWNVLGWLAIAPAAGLLGLAIAIHGSDEPSHASGYGALAAILIGLGLLTIKQTWPTASGSILLVGAAALTPIAVEQNGARPSWLVAGTATLVALIVVRRQARPWGLAIGVVAGLTAALALLPHDASSTVWAALAAAIGAAAVIAGVQAKRIDIGHAAAGTLWVAWLGGRLIQHGQHENLAVQTVLLATVAAAVLLADAILNRRPVLAWVGAGAATVAAITAADHGNIQLLEGYTLPVAGLLLLAGLVWRSQRPSTSIVWAGPAAFVALVPSACATWLAPWVDWSESESPTHLARLIVLIVVAGLVAAAGSRLHWAGLLIPASIALGIAATAQIWATCHYLPKWVVLAAVGAALVTAGARQEWLRDQRTRLDDWAGHLA
jgi:hypothetical protein